MLHYLKLYWKIGKRELEAIPQAFRKMVLLCSILAVILLLAAANYICGFFLKHISSENIILYGTFFLLYAGIIYLPAGIYKNYFENSKIEILLLAPIETRKAYSYYISWELVKKTGVFCLIYSIFIVSFQREGIDIVYTFLSFLSIWIDIYLLFLLIISMLYIGFGQKAKKIYLVMTGIFEIVGFILFYQLIEGQWSPTALKEIYKWTEQRNLIFLSIIFIAQILLYYANTYQLQRAVLAQGIVKDSYSKVQKSKHSKRKNYFLEKDIKLFFRDLDRMKYILVTIIIFFATTLLGGKKAEMDSAVIMAILFIIIIGLQISYDNYMIEKEKISLMFLAGMKTDDFFRHKIKFSYIIIGTLGALYSTALATCCNLSAQEWKEFILVIAFVIVMLTRVNSYLMLELSLVFYRGEIRIRECLQVIRIVLKILCYNLLIMMAAVIIMLMPVSCWIKGMMFIMAEEGYRIHLKHKDRRWSR